MKVAVVVLAFLGSALAASIDSEVDIPPFRSMEVDPIRNESESPVGSGLRIINGREVVPHSIPYQVYLVGRSFLSSWSCGGSLITPLYVLTAAHCIDGARSVQVTLGGHNLRTSSPGQITVNAAGWIMHERYNPNTIDNDIGVVGLANPVSLTNNIRVSRLPTFSDVGANLVGYSARVSGWGLTSGSGSGSDVLREVNNTIISNVECNAVFGIVKDEEVCLSGEGGRSACQGDSGGPLVLGNTQIGIVSYGTRGCVSGYPSAYVRVTKFLAWILDNTDYRQ